MVLKFGKHRGMRFEDTPKSYQDWLLKQSWFKSTPLTNALNGWDGHSRKGQAVYEAVFEQEMRMAEKEDCRIGICSCCPGSSYYGF